MARMNNELVLKFVQLYSLGIKLAELKDSICHMKYLRRHHIASQGTQNKGWHVLDIISYCIIQASFIIMRYEALIHPNLLLLHG